MATYRVNKTGAISEHDLQRSCINWFHVQHPKRLIFAIPNAGKRSYRLGAYMKAEGLTAGVPDLCIPEPANGYHGLWVEMKTKGGEFRESQQHWQRALRMRGYMSVVCWSFDDFVNCVNTYFNETKQQ